MAAAPLKLLITGASGFVGKTLAQHVCSQASGVVCVQPSQKIELTDSQCLDELIAETRPDRIVHLAAQSFVPQAFADPLGTYQVNFIGTLNLLQSLKKHGFNGRLLFVGSGDQYGLIEPSDLPVLETQPMKPRNPYAVSKIAAEMLCYQWSQTEGMDIVMARPFNHIGPGQNHRFVIPGFARQIAAIKMGLAQPVMETGNLHVTRDFTDVRDIVKAYLLLLEQGKSGDVYNVCSGKEVLISDVLQQLLEIAGVEADIKLDPNLVRANEQQRSFGNPDKIFRDTGWKPVIPLTQSLCDIFNEQQAELAAQSVK